MLGKGLVLIGLICTLTLTACAKATNTSVPSPPPGPQVIPTPTTSAIQQHPTAMTTSHQTKGVVVGSVVNLYSQPSKAVDVVTQATLGTELSIWESRDGWYYVRMPDQYQGWIEASQVRVYAEGERSYASAGQVAEVRNLLAFLYHEPDVTAHAPALQVTIGTRMEVVEDRGDWVTVVLPDRAVRWIQKGDVTIAPADAPKPRGSGLDLVETAKRFLGLPYQWGGCTPLGIDCSGFVQLVYRLNGISLLRDADIQYTQPNLQPVARENLQPGDLVFFGQGRVSHVGMYIGNGEFIHATTHERPIVQISRLDEPYWVSLYQGARRP
ncbi:MAG: C40 family peptidase [Chloroflexi bacterium]|nr:C40 family peptidase [Chloroflexota bacterium]